MTNHPINPKSLLISFIIGALITLLAFGIPFGRDALVANYWAKASSETPSKMPKNNFAVVDTYKGCDVVQWNNYGYIEYFLHCTDSIENQMTCPTTE